MSFRVNPFLQIVTVSFDSSKISNLHLLRGFKTTLHFSTDTSRYIQGYSVSLQLFSKGFTIEDRLRHRFSRRLT